MVYLLLTTSYKLHMENKEQDFLFNSKESSLGEEIEFEDTGLSGETENEDDQGFGLDREKLRDADRKKVYLCFAIAAVVFIISLFIWPLDYTNLNRTNKAAEMFVQGLFHLDPALIGRGLIMMLQCMLGEMKELGRGVLLIAITFIIIRLTILRKKKPKE